MLRVDDLECLSNFKQLAEITLHKRVMRDLYDVGDMLKYSPKLVSLHISGFQKEIGDHETSNDINTVGISHNKIRSLSMPSYIPATDKEMLYLIETCPNLKYLYMSGYLGDSWPSALISGQVMKRFMGYILQIKSLHVLMEGDSGEKSKMDEFL